MAKPLYSSYYIFHQTIPFPNITNVSERWVCQKKNECRVNSVETLSLRSMCGVSRKDRCRNSDVRCGLEKDAVTRVERAQACIKTDKKNLIIYTRAARPRLRRLQPPKSPSPPPAPVR
ncbi:hypothetical protein EVAR_59240_1 [Eumeta japonica]|uniref:Uncharacterized protein n=1 Tax=Eumeta variegata TaxID=151549 RepID=A0A4C1ZI54_EUMVA|nr:hypothetical protein EVAR_59240_1 [Eumeta japonica]